MEEAEEQAVIIDVTTDNAPAVLSIMLKQIENADFVAIDQELSGLGNTAGRKHLDMDGYYKRVREAAEERAVISMGISCFKSSKDFVKAHPDMCDRLLFDCCSFNIFLIPEGQFHMDGSARRFLVAHGFNMNWWAENAISYARECQTDFMSSVVDGLLTSKASIVFHNGLLDLAYFYSSFYGSLPKLYLTFTADIADMFGGRLFDTKVICDKQLNWRLSSLEYCFKKSQRVSSRARNLGQPAALIRQNIPEVPADSLVKISVSENVTVFEETPVVGIHVCELMYHSGFCNAFKTGDCQHPVENHQMDLVLDVEESLRKRKETSGEQKDEPEPKKRFDFDSLSKSPKEKVSGEANGDMEPGEIATTEEERVKLKGIFNFQPKIKAAKSTERREVHPQLRGTSHFTIDNNKTYNLDFGLHSAGFDAFMTGYVFATSLAQLGRTEKEGRIQFTKSEGFVNRIHVTGKNDHPCNFVKSSTAKFSDVHEKLVARIRNTKAEPL
ncbi:hypothetical protein RvY_06212 [Ramazzottius varieornatus]|uniref:C3H1-type domain-containing protein n=1 Tax=Ramazzottius varieornatus TaxID=947166 RepID=A0A1D1V0R9_RAMVA|nr:hypothetical protein RvY_06212 [Ramazzottius varieornatus]